MFCIHLCKQESWAIFARVRTAKRSAGYNHDDSTLWKMTTVNRPSSWNFLSIHYVTYFIRRILQISTKNVTLQVPFRGISWENIHFCGFLEKTYIANGSKIKVNSTRKYVKFLSSGYFFFVVYFSLKFLLSLVFYSYLMFTLWVDTISVLTNSKIFQSKSFPRIYL